MFYGSSPQEVGFFFFFTFKKYFGHMVCGILVPRSGIEPTTHYSGSAES